MKTMQGQQGSERNTHTAAEARDVLRRPQMPVHRTDLRLVRDQDAHTAGVKAGAARGGLEGGISGSSLFTLPPRRIAQTDIPTASDAQDPNSIFAALGHTLHSNRRTGGVAGTDRAAWRGAAQDVHLSTQHGMRAGVHEGHVAFVREARAQLAADDASGFMFHPRFWSTLWRLETQLGLHRTPHQCAPHGEYTLALHNVAMDDVAALRQEKLAQQPQQGTLPMGQLPGHAAPPALPPSQAWPVASAPGTAPLSTRCNSGPDDSVQVNQYAGASVHQENVVQPRRHAYGRAKLAQLERAHGAADLKSSH